MKIIFLDIDGVLNSRRFDNGCNRKEGEFIDITRLKLIKELVDKTDAEIVLSTSWRVEWDKDEEHCTDIGKQINKLFESCGLKIYDKTSFLGDRKQEIECYANGHGVNEFVIVDDNVFGWGELSSKFIKTNPIFGLGFEQEHLEQALKILGAE